MLMSKGPATRHMVAEWDAVSDRTAVARAMYEDLLLEPRPGLASIRTPITLLYPDNVPLGVPPRDDGEGLSRALCAGRERTHVVADSQHFIMLDQPQAFAAALDGFLAGGN